MKKIVSLLLAVMMVLSMSACRGNETTIDNDTGVSTTQNQTDVTDTSSTEQNTDTPSSTTDNIGGSDSTDVPSSTTSTPTTTTKPEASNPTITEPETSKPSTPTHTHSYSNATCTEPAKCSCGATDGNALGHKYSNATCTEAKKCSRCGETSGKALGHKWQEATCKAPKTCSVCKTTEGNLGNHKYTNGKCNYCSKQQIINPKTGLKKGADYYHVSVSGDGYCTLIIWQFDGTIICPKNPNGVYSTNEEWKESDDTISYKGKTYYPVGSGGPLPRYYLTDTEIILDYKNEPELLDDPFYANAEYKLIVNYEYDLEVVYSSGGGMFKKGDILELVE